MSSTDVGGEGASQVAGVSGVDASLKVIVIHRGGARDLVARGIELSEVFHEGAAGARFHPEANTRLIGFAPDRRTYGSFASFSDPDGNAWLLQEVSSRLPGRVDSAVTTFASARDLAGALRRVEAAHGEHEKRIGKADANWPDWYATYMVAEQAGAQLPT